MINMKKIEFQNLQMYFSVFIIGIKYDFPFINIRNVPREVLKTEGEA